MINAYWQELQFQIQEGAPQDWARIVDTGLPSPNDFSESGLPLQQSIYQVAPRSIVVLVRASARNCSLVILSERRRMAALHCVSRITVY